MESVHVGGYELVQGGSDEGGARSVVVEKENLGLLAAIRLGIAAKTTGVRALGTRTRRWDEAGSGGMNMIAGCDAMT